MVSTPDGDTFGVNQLDFDGDLAATPEPSAPPALGGVRSYIPTFRPALAARNRGRRA
jgi:hypothetical protein